MKVVKWIVIVAAVLLVAGVISTFFMSENFRVSQTQVIKASPEAVYNQIVTVKNWENWSYWHGLDDKMITTYNDIPSGVGASYSWKSEKKSVGSGSFTIIRVEPNSYVQGKLNFEGHEGEAWSEYILKPVEGGTELTSAMNSTTKGIFDKLMSRLMGKPMMHKAFKASADNMEAYLQNNPNTASVIDSLAAASKMDSTIKSSDRDCVMVKK
jgi:uncharacterized protein YndB with AHSA1/START domain